MALDKDPLDVALDIKRHFARTVAHRDRPAKIDRGYVLGVVVWWLVIFAGASVAGLGWIGAALLATLLSGFWPILTRS
jgi:hypothetical protein